MKKKVELKKMKLNKTKIMNLSKEQMDLIKGAGIYETIKQGGTSLAVGVMCTSK